MTALILGLVGFVAALLFTCALVIIGEQEREIERLHAELAARDAAPKGLPVRLKARPPVRLLTCNPPTMIVWN